MISSCILLDINFIYSLGLFRSDTISADKLFFSKYQYHEQSPLKKYAFVKKLHLRTTQSHAHLMIVFSIVDDGPTLSTY